MAAVVRNRHVCIAIFGKFRGFSQRFGAAACSRQCHSVTETTEEELWRQYHETKQLTQEQKPLCKINPTSVFANNELCMGDVEVYGFDYDYTLAHYTEELYPLIYNLAKERLLMRNKYPDSIMALEYIPGFAVRGLHYDIEKALLMKIDAFHHIQLGTVYRGHQQVSDEEVFSLYDGTHVPMDYMSSFHGRGKQMVQLMDMFSLSEMALLCDITEFFLKNGIEYDPEYLFYDVKNAVISVHLSGDMHKAVAEDMDRYLERGDEVSQVLRRLAGAGKKLFLITNSPYWFVQRGMEYIAGPNWMEMFDVVIAESRKPKFFTDQKRPFREVSKTMGTCKFERVTSLRKGQVYIQGNLQDFRHMTGWYGARVLYFGDHVYSDLADPFLRHGWRTGAIIPELEDEIKISNSSSYKDTISWLLALQGLIESQQKYRHDPAVKTVLPEWMEEMKELRHYTKDIFNPQFGSLFRTHHNPTYFSRRLMRFADIYTSSVANLLHFPIDYTFYPRRSALPHEINYDS
ncbi:NT5DC3 [Branchiostoma lanceolatum]|uniref:NT5DC3 protein n=1 Tax=Branchiostoma lanceolatum TaxID=7740 RepID=A0A8J9Z179_BRALA|nr:NT5DC3 [Branchiostoma lanceolatum]